MTTSLVKMNRVPWPLGNRELEIGDFWWEREDWKKDSEASGRIFVVFPPEPTLKAKYGIHWVPCSINGTGKKEDRQWNGDWEKPTISGSWGIDHFHCWVIDGFMTLDRNFKRE